MAAGTLSAAALETALARPWLWQNCALFLLSFSGTSSSSCQRESKEKSLWKKRRWLGLPYKLSMGYGWGSAPSWACRRSTGWVPRSDGKMYHSSGKKLALFECWNDAQTTMFAGLPKWCLWRPAAAGNLHCIWDVNMSYHLKQLLSLRAEFLITTILHCSVPITRLFCFVYFYFAICNDNVCQPLLNPLHYPYSYWEAQIRKLSYHHLPNWCVILYKLFFTGSKRSNHTQKHNSQQIIIDLPKLRSNHLHRQMDQWGAVANALPGIWLNTC